MRTIPNLDVLLHGEQIGTLTYIGGDRSVFEFSDSFASKDDRPSLGLGFSDIYGELITEFRGYRTKIMPFFSNLLPEDFLRKFLAERAGVNVEREFLLLMGLGKDLPGAVSVVPSDAEQSHSDGKVSGSKETDIGSSRILRFSLAGVQLKFSAVQKMQGGYAVPATGDGGDWIVKLPSPLFEGLPENEFSMMTLAELTGINIPKCELVESSRISNLPDEFSRISANAFAIKRFDRSNDNGPVHIEDFAQVFGLFPHDKYDKASFQNILSVIATACTIQDVVEFVKRLTFSMLIGNADMHVKNWSLIYYDRINPSLSPAYDFVSTIPYLPGDSTNMRISKHKEFSKFDSDELARLAAFACVPKKLVLDSAKETVERFLEAWRKEAGNLPMADEVRNSIEKHMKGLPIYREFSRN